MILLALLLAQGLWGFAQPVASQAGTLNVTLELAPDEALLVSRLNPPEISLKSPWKASPLAATVSGEPWAEHPDLYFSRVDPVQWTLKVPADTSPGQYEAVVSAKLGLCKNDDGFCFVREATQTLSLTVGTAGDVKVGGQESVEVTLRFHTPSFDNDY